MWIWQIPVQRDTRKILCRWTDWPRTIHHYPIPTNIVKYSWYKMSGKMDLLLFVPLINYALYAQLSWFVVQFVLTTSTTSYLSFHSWSTCIGFGKFQSSTAEAVWALDYTITFRLWCSSRPKYIQPLTVVQFHCTVEWEIFVIKNYHQLPKWRKFNARKFYDGE